jgi:hypothetical protein
MQVAAGEDLKKSSLIGNETLLFISVQAKITRCKSILSANPTRVFIVGEAFAFVFSL